LSARMKESDAQDFLTCLSRCYVAAFQRSDRATADRIREGMEEFERLRKVEPVDHPFRPGEGSYCAKEGCGRGADEHLAYGLRLMAGGRT